MTTPRRQAVLGLFVAGALGIFAAGLFAIGDIQQLFDRRITVHTELPRVDGLKAGNGVWFAGLPVGTVRSVQLVDGHVGVRMAIEADAAESIPRNVVASIGSDGLIGNTIIVLDAEDPMADPGPLGLVPDGRLEGEASPSVDDLMDEVRETNQALLAIAGDVELVTSRIAAGEGTLGRLIAEESLYDEIEATAANMRSATERADFVTGRLVTVTRDLTAEGSLVHSLANDEETWPEVQAAVADFRAVSADTRDIVARLDDSLQDPNTPAGVLLAGEEAGSDLEATLANLENGSELLEENLEAMQHNFLLRGFFKKKERREKKLARQEGRKSNTDGLADQSE